MGEYDRQLKCNRCGIVTHFFVTWLSQYRNNPEIREFDLCERCSNLYRNFMTTLPGDCKNEL